MSLEGHKIVLTGGSGGIGSRVARELALRGGDVLVIDRVEPQDLPVRFLHGDLAHPAGIDAVARAVAVENPDMLVNLAGVQYLGPVEGQDSGHVLVNYLVNLVAPVRLTQAVLPQMRQRRSGHIVNIGSVLGSINYPYFVTYSSAKAGLRGFSEGLRREVRSDGIDVTYIAPRAVRTGLSTGLVEQFAKLTGMTLDEPEFAVTRIVQAIIRRRRNVVIGLPEQLFVKINALVPLMVDNAIGKQEVKARRFFAS
jgi:short-subunit dehydrogenase